MWSCPVCIKNYKEEYSCPICGFDTRRDCTRLPSLVPLSVEELAELEKMWLPKPKSNIEEKVTEKVETQTEVKAEAKAETKAKTKAETDLKADMKPSNEGFSAPKFWTPSFVDTFMTGTYDSKGGKAENKAEKPDKDKSKEAKSVDAGISELKSDDAGFTEPNFSKLKLEDPKSGELKSGERKSGEPKKRTDTFTESTFETNPIEFGTADFKPASFAGSLRRAETSGSSSGKTETSGKQVIRSDQGKAESGTGIVKSPLNQFPVKAWVSFSTPEQRQLWDFNLSGRDRVLEWDYLHAQPRDFYRAYGDETFKKKESAVFALSRTEIISGAEQLYNDLMQMYCCSMSELINVTKVKRNLSAHREDGFDHFRHIMLGIFLWRSSDAVRKANAYKAVDIFRTLSTEGDPLAQAWLGEALYIGRGIDKDQNRAQKLWENCKKDLTTLAERGNGEAQYMLGRRALASDDPVTARKWLERAWSNRCIIAGNELGDLGVTGSNSDQQKRLGYAYYMTAAWHNMPETMRRLGYCYEHGIGTKRDIDQAERCYYLALRNKEPEMMYTYGKFLYQTYTNRRDDAVDYLLAAKNHGLKKAEIFLKEVGLLNTSKKVNEENLDWGTRREYNRFH